MRVIVSESWAKYKIAITLAGVIFVGAALRFYTLDWGEGYFFHVDERLYVVGRTLKFWRAIITEGDFNPHMSTYGTLPLYALIAARTLVLTFVAIIQKIPLTADYLLADHLGVTILTGRIISALLSASTIYLFYKIGKRLYNQAVGIIAAILVSTTVALIQAAHYYTVDSMLLFFLALAFGQAISVAQEGDYKSYVLAGVCLALALAVKLPALFLVPVFGVAHLLNSKRSLWSRRFNLGLLSHVLDLRILVAVGAALVTYIAVSPFSLLDFQGLFLTRNTEFNALRNVNLAFTKPLATWTLAYEGLIPYVYEITTLLFFGYGLPLEIVALLGTGLMLRRREKSDLLLLTWVVPVFLIIGINRIKTIRYILPLIPFLAVCGAVFIVEIWLWGQKSRPRTWLALLISGSVIGSTLLYAVAFTHMYGQRDSRLQASDWLYQNAPRGSIIVVEDELYYTAQLGIPDAKLQRWNQAISDPVHNLPYIHEVRLLFSPYYDTYSYELLDNLSRTTHIQDTIAGANYIVVSERHYHTYSRLRELRPVEYQYYEDLFSGKMGYHMVAVFDPSPNLWGLNINDDGAELYFKAFDHPKIWIFQQNEFIVQVSHIQDIRSK